MTTAKYYTPKGRSIQAEGITPDIVVKLVRPPVEEKEPVEDHMLREKDLKGHIKNDSKPEEAKKETDDLARDNQLKNAIDILKSWELMKRNLKG